VPLSKIINALEEYSPSNNRSQLEIGENNELILDAYNANPDSMKQALNNFSASKAKNKAVILGDMLELGSIEEMEHKSILDLLGTLNIDKSFFVGPAFSLQKENYPQFQFFNDNIEARKYFEENPIKDYRILLKGSRGIKLEILKEQLL
jgi:UDP-N-acetylmuramoyl-tripeptide--D-alanyl-D-alanine ligase